MRETRIFESLDRLSYAAAELFVAIGAESIAKRERFAVALSGGSTPKSLYKLLASEQFRDVLDWKKIFFFFGDERNVARDSLDSNYRMADETLFSALPLNLDSVHEWPTFEEGPGKIAGDYAREMEQFFHGFPRFDLVLLGLGNDGHTASLFPNTDALKEKDAIAVSNWVPKLDDHRFTMTFPVLNNAANVIFLVSGKEKAETVAAVLEGGFRPDELPAQFVQPVNGNLYWLLDQAAASKLQLA
ncbi:MAG TPA: 6-phosphogluconolactonase [Pyrinomonadaceae bacterium]|nr:6-phosphogluconolactonase [Pyrinomonadaceae bacterium]